jgi:hypothetical protein
MRILTDCGKIFMSKLFKQLCHLFGVHHMNTTPYHPQANGQNERSHAVLHRFLGIVMKGYPKVEWHTWCNAAAWLQNSSVHTTIKRTPYEALFGRLPPVQPFGIPEMEPLIEDELEKFLDLRSEQIKTIIDESIDVIHSMRHTSLERANRNAKPQLFLEGDEVIVRMNHVKGVARTKWGPLYIVNHIQLCVSSPTHA